MDPPDRTCAEAWSISRLSASHGLSALRRGRGGRAAGRSRFARSAGFVRALFARARHRPLGAGGPGLGVDERDRLLELHRLRGLVVRQRGVDAVMADLGPVAAGLWDNR